MRNIVSEMPLRNYKFKGHILLYSLIIVLLISLVAFFLYMDLLFKLRTDGELTLNLKSRAIQYEGFRLINTPGIQYDKRYVFPYDRQYTLSTWKKRWGCYDLYYSMHSNDSLNILKKAALIGYGKNEQENTALNLQSSNSNLYILGSVDIKGNMNVPFGFVKPYDFQQVNHLNDNTLKCKDTFTVLKNYNLLKSWLQSESQKQPNQASFPNTIKVSFWDSTLRIYTDSLVVTGKIEGNVILSGRYIKISRKADINDAIIISKKVVIESGFAGSLQVFATERISIDSSVSLKYPSTICFFPTDPNSNSKIHVSDFFSIEGEVYLYSDNKLYNASSKMYVGKNSHINGGVFSSSALTWEGFCKGTITCRTINSYNIPQKNLLSNSVIDIQGQPGYYTYSILYPYGEVNKLVKWLE